MKGLNSLESRPAAGTDGRGQRDRVSAPLDHLPYEQGSLG
jgi:hypothetical protein